MDQVLVVVTSRPPHRSEPRASAEQRLAWCRRVFARVDGGMVVAEETLNPATGAAYTIATLEEVHVREPQAELFLLVGADELVRFTTWHRWRDFAGLAQLAIAPRPEVSPESIEKALLELSQAGLTTITLEMPLHSASATAARAHLGEADLDGANALVPAEILDDVVRSGAYADPALG